MRYFTIEEARAVLPEIAPLVGGLLEARAKVVVTGQGMQDVLGDLQSDVGGPKAARLVAEFEKIESLIEQIQSYGCAIKSVEAGLIDFLYDMDGRDVYLCWRYGEPTIAYYHDIHEGYNGRRPLAD
jgi:hypothetical protein